MCATCHQYSCRFVNAREYLDTLLRQIYKYQNEGILCIARDFNGRCGLMDDFIEGVDELPMCDIVDSTVNQHGERLCELIISANMHANIIHTPPIAAMKKYCLTQTQIQNRQEFQVTYYWMIPV